MIYKITIAEKTIGKFCKELIHIINLYEIEKMRIIVFEKNKENKELLIDILEFNPNKFIIKSKPGISKYITNRIKQHLDKKIEIEIFSPQEEQEANLFGH